MGRNTAYSFVLGIIWLRITAWSERAVLLCCAVLFSSCLDNLPTEPARRDGRSAVTKSVMSFSSSRTDGTMTVRMAAPVVTSVDRVFVTTTRGGVGSETLVFQNEIFSWNGARFVGQKKWPAQANDYHMYASSVPAEFRSGGTVVWADGSSDVVCGYCGDAVWGAVNSFSLEHVFGLLDTVTLVAEPGWTLSNLSVTIDALTGGTYDIRKGASSQNPWSEVVTESALSIIPTSPGSRDVGLFLIPGTYRVSAEWRATYGSSTCDYSDMSASLEITAGKSTDVTITLGGEMTLSVSLLDWDTPIINVSETS